MFNFPQTIFAVKDLPTNHTVGEFLNKQIEAINNATSELIVHGQLKYSFN